MARIITNIQSMWPQPRHQHRPSLLMMLLLHLALLPVMTARIS
jgi:hypothetical protein